MSIFWDNQSEVPQFVHNFCKQHQTELVLVNSSEIPFCLKFCNETLAMDGELFREQKMSPLLFDFEKLMTYHKRQNYKLSKQPIIRSVGRPKEGLTVIDGSFGSGSDSFLLISLGHTVMSFERNPYIYLLASDGLSKLSQEVPLKINFGSFQESVHREKIEALEKKVLFFDPMFIAPAHKKNKPKAKKEMQIFKMVVGPDEDQQEILKNSLAQFEKVVVKRPLRAEKLLLPVSDSVEGKSIRYDIYLR